MSNLQRMACHGDAAAPESEGNAVQGSEARKASLTPTYLATAHRWGATNNHSYHVYGGLDRTKAIALAQAEREGRGGKYAVVVWAFDDDGTDYRSVAYFPSSMEEEGAVVPHHNHRIDYFEHLGHFLDSMVDGHCLLPDPLFTNTLSLQAVECPEYARVEVARQRQILAVWLDLDTKHKAGNS